MLKNYGALGARELEPPGKSGIGGNWATSVPITPLANSRSATTVFFSFDLMQRGGHLRLHRHHIAHQPQQQIHRMHALIDQSAAAIERKLSAPAGISVIIRRAIPLYLRVGENWFAEQACGEKSFQAMNGRRGAVLKYTLSFTPPFSHSAISASARAVLISIGFSVRTCSP